MRFSITTSQAKKIRSEGTGKRAETVSLKYLEDGDYRFSAVVSKKQGCAAERNRVKRVIREIMREKENVYPPGLYMVYFRGKCLSLNRTRVIRDLDRLMNTLSQGKKQASTPGTRKSI